jgi:hypothetical protein
MPRDSFRGEERRTTMFLLRMALLAYVALMSSPPLAWAVANKYSKRSSLAGNAVGAALVGKVSWFEIV